MGVDQYSSHHVFKDMPDGDRVVLMRDSSNAKGVHVLRAHLERVVEAFERGDFRLPGNVLASEVPATREMAVRRTRIMYTLKNRAGSGAIHIHSTDADAVRAIHAFLASARAEYRPPGHEHKP